MNWFNIIKISEDELDSVKPWIRDELAEGKKDKGAAYSRLWNRFNRRPTKEELNQELKVKPHRDKRRPVPFDATEYNRAYGRLRYRLGRNPTQDEIVAEIENPTHTSTFGAGYRPSDDTGRINREEEREKLKEKHPVPEKSIAHSKGDFVTNTLEVFIADVFDLNLLDVAGKTTKSDNQRFFAYERYLDKFTENEFMILSKIKNDIPKLMETLLELMESFHPKNKRKKNEYARRYKANKKRVAQGLPPKPRKNTKKPKPKPKPKPRLSERRDIL